MRAVICPAQPLRAPMPLRLPYAGLYDVLGRDVEGVLEPLDLGQGATQLHELLRPAHALLGKQDNPLAELAFVWLLPGAADPLPAVAVARVAEALAAGRVVAVRAGDASAIEAAKQAVLSWAGGTRPQIALLSELQSHSGTRDGQ